MIRKIAFIVSVILIILASLLQLYLALQDYTAIQSTLNAWKIVGTLFMGMVLTGGVIWVNSPEPVAKTITDEAEEDDVLGRELF